MTEQGRRWGPWVRAWAQIDKTFARRSRYGAQPPIFVTAALKRSRT